MLTNIQKARNGLIISEMGGESKETHQQSVKGWDYCLDVSSGKYIQNNLYLYVLRVLTSMVFLDSFVFERFDVVLIIISC